MTMTAEAIFSPNRLRQLLCLALASLCAPPAWAAQPLGCLIEPERTAEIGSQVVGVIEAIPVERGDRVSKGQVVAMLHAQSERAAVGVAQAKLDADAEVRAAEASAAFARQQYQRSQDLFEKNFISRQALDQAHTEADVSQQKLSLARQQKRVTDRELSYVQAQLAQRQIRSPFDGIVAERYLSPGERVEEKPVLRLAQVNPLRVQVVAPVGVYGQIGVGDTASVLPEMPNSQPHAATVVQVDKIVDPASNTFRVVLHLPNPDFSLPAGLRCKADFTAAVSRPVPPKIAATVQSQPNPPPSPLTPPATPANDATTPAENASTVRQTAAPEAKASAALITVPSMPLIAASHPDPVEPAFGRPSAIATANADYYAARQAKADKPMATVPGTPSAPSNAPGAAPEEKARTGLNSAASMPIIAASDPASAEPMLSHPSAIAMANADFYAARLAAANKPAVITTLVSASTPATPMPVTAALATTTSGSATPPPSGATGTENRPLPTGNDRDGIEKALGQWRTTWTNKDLAAYLACYDADFRMPDGRPLAALAKERRRRFAENSPIRVHYDSLQITFDDPGRARIQLRLNYQSGDETYVTTRLMTLVHRNGQWLIAGDQKQG